MNCHCCQHRQTDSDQGIHCNSRQVDFFNANEVFEPGHSFRIKNAGLECAFPLTERWLY